MAMASCKEAFMAISFFMSIKGISQGTISTIINKIVWRRNFFFYVYTLIFLQVSFLKADNCRVEISNEKE